MPKTDEPATVEQRHRDAAMGVLNHAFRNEPIDGVSGECFDDIASAFARFEAHLRTPATDTEAMGECICPKCGIRHGLSNTDGGF